MVKPVPNRLIKNKQKIDDKSPNPSFILSSKTPLALLAMLAPLVDTVNSARREVGISKSSCVLIGALGTMLGRDGVTSNKCRMSGAAS